MNKLHITIIILVLLILGFFVVKKSNKIETPDGSEISSINTSNEEETIIAKTSETNEIKEFVIIGQNFSYMPSVITVKKGDKVKIVFQNVSGFHDLKIDEYGLTTKQEKSPSTGILEFTADKVGSFEYYCSVGTHKASGMKGTLVVQ